MKTVKFTAIIILMFLVQSCNKQPPVAYQVLTENVTKSSANKAKMKSEEQYISILYANLFQEALPANKLVEITNLISSIGDKEAAHELVISNFMNDPNVKMPKDDYMHKNPEKFIIETYERFLVRAPSEAEKTYFVNYIKSKPQLTVEMVYTSFALSNEYLYY